MTVPNAAKRVFQIFSNLIPAESFERCYNHIKFSTKWLKSYTLLFSKDIPEVDDITEQQTIFIEMSAKWCIALTLYLIKYSFNEPPPHTSLSDRPLWKPSALWPASQHNSHTVFRAPQRPLGGGQLSSRAVSAQASAVRRGDERNCTRASITVPAQEPCSIMAFT